MEKLKVKGGPPPSHLRAMTAKEEEPTQPRTRVHPPRLPPQQHLASLAGRGVLKGKHLKVMPVGSGVLGVDVGAGEGTEHGWNRIQP